MNTDRLSHFRSFSSKFAQKKYFYFVCYTAAFLILALIVYSPFLYNGKSLIWKPDGLTQHYNALLYFGNWGRSILNTLFTEHRLSIPLWDFSIGYGSDVLTTFHYYVIGDPLNLLAIFTPARYTEALYSFLILLRLYLAGLSFSFFCFQMKRRGSAVLAGSLAYVFCGYAVILAPMHPYFVNPMIYLPLLILGAERVLQKKSPNLLIGMTALSALSNFYFFYMQVILVVIFCIIRFASSRHDHFFRELFPAVLRMTIFSALGASIAAVLLIPVGLCFLSDARSGSELTYAFLYSREYYEQFFDQFLSLQFSSGWTYLGFAPVVLLCIFLLFQKKKQFLPLKAAFIVLTAMLLLPAAGSFMNGFSYTANRWGFGYSFLAALILVYLWPELFRLTLKEKGRLLLLTFLYLILLLNFQKAGSSDAFAGLVVLLLTLAVLSLGPSLFALLPGSVPPLRLTQLSTLFLMTVSISSVSLSYCSLYADSYLNRFVDRGEGIDTLKESASGMMSVFYGGNPEFSRFAQDLVPVRNDSIHHNVNTIQYYWSLSNGQITRFFDELALPVQERTFKYDDLDSRFSLYALASVKYFVQENLLSYVPYPFSEPSIREYFGDAYYVYESPQTLPLGYTYDSFLTRGQYDALSPLQRQQALLQGLLLEETPEGFPETELRFHDTSLDFEISCGSSLFQEGNTFYALQPQTELTFSFDSPADCETYLYIKGLHASSSSSLELYTEEPFSSFQTEGWDTLTRFQKNKIRREHAYNEPVYRFTMNLKSACVNTDFSCYSGLTESSFDRNDFLINMGYSTSGQTQAVLTLPYAGTYSFDSIEVFSLPLDPARKEIGELGSSCIRTADFGVNSVHAQLSLPEKKLLCLSLPYAKGWTARVNGKNVPLYPVNTMYMGLALDEGEHTIELSYLTPGLKEGFAVSLAGLGVWGILALVQKKKRR